MTYASEYIVDTIDGGIPVFIWLQCYTLLLTGALLYYAAETKLKVILSTLP